MSNDFRGWGVPQRRTVFDQAPAFGNCVDAGKVAERCRVSGLEFKLQLVYSKENNLKVEL
ncbi:MAG: hypothetical protein DMF70_01070 [Acidobacteria bacterium]|nr:MAG: hypothetical protein DMF70_01070 [Acidobacteriota bacterium]